MGVVIDRSVASSLGVCCGRMAGGLGRAEVVGKNWLF